ncbi:MAG: hypothetical protein RRY39_06730 [Odoribacter sp.]
MNNIGGLSRICICPFSNLSTDGTILSTNELIPLFFTDDTGSRKCSRKEDKNGIYYDISIECLIARSDTDLKLIDSFPLEFAIVTTDNNLVSRLDGSSEEPFRLEMESDTGVEFKDFNSIKLKFSRKLRFFSPVVIL